MAVMTARSITFSTRAHSRPRRDSSRRALEAYPESALHFEWHNESEKIRKESNIAICSRSGGSVD